MFLDEPLEAEMAVWSVSDFSQQLQKNLQQHVPLAWIVGELSGIYKAQSGHVYATLKDEQAQIKVVVYASLAQRLVFKLEEGLKVKCLAQATLYRPRGELQLVAKNLEPDGLGPLKLAFEQIKNKLQAEGLFASSHKRSLPSYPESIALITSADGAVYHDMMRVLMRRYPIARVRLFPCLVQGSRAINDIVRALKECAQQGEDDIAIIARGGGSLEDLWAFNSEEVVRAVFDFPLPIISAIGHETDITLCDFVADLRAATPSVAAELAVPSVKNVFEKLTSFEQSWFERFKQILQQYQQRLDYQERFLKQSSFLFDQLKNQIEQAHQKLQTSMERRLDKESFTLKHQASFLSYMQHKLLQEQQGYLKQCRQLFHSCSTGLQARYNHLIQDIEHLSFRFNQLNPENPEQLSLIDTHKTRIKSAVGIEPGKRAQLKFYDGAWIIEFIQKMGGDSDNVLES